MGHAIRILLFMPTFMHNLSYFCSRTWKLRHVQLQVLGPMFFIVHSIISQTTEKATHGFAVGHEVGSAWLLLNILSGIVLALFRKAKC